MPGGRTRRRARCRRAVAARPLRTRRSARRRPSPPARARTRGTRCHATAARCSSRRTQSGEDVSRRIREDDHRARVAGGRPEQARVVRVAADDAVEDDNVHLGRLLGDEVSMTALDPPGDPRLGRELARNLVVAGRELDDDGVRGAALEELDEIAPMPPPASRTDFPSTPCAPIASTIHRPPAQPASPVARSVASSLSGREELVVSRSGAAAGDGMTVSPTRTLVA